VTTPNDETPCPSSLQEWALEYAGQGYRIFPCFPKAKQPHIRGGFKSATKDPKQIKQWWSTITNANIGLVPGSAGHLVIDVDGPEGRATAERLRLLPSGTRTVNTGRGLHLYFKHPGGKIGNKRLGQGLDVRADHGYVLAPPSVHPTGAVYTWVDPTSPILPLPDQIADQLRGVEREGGRNNALASYLGGLRRNGTEEAQLVEAALEFNRTRCDPPLSDSEARAVARTIATYKPAFASPAEMRRQINREFAVIQIGGKVRILREHGDQLDFLGLHDFRLLLRNRVVIVQERSRSVADLFSW
jgi:hypothetical protein